MTIKPNEIRHSQVSCELENYCLQRGQSLSYSADLNSETVNQLTDLETVEVVDSDPSVTISMDVNEFGSTLLYTILSGRYQGFPDETFSVEDIMLNPVDLLVSVKESSSQTLANRSAWFNNCFVDSISGNYQVDGFATESVSLSGNNMTWFATNDTSHYGATKIFKFDVVDGTGKVDSYFDDLGQHGYLHYLTDNGLLVPADRYVFDSLTHSVVPQNDFSFVDGHRYRGVFWGRSDFPTPSTSADPIGGLVSKEIEVVLWDSTTDPIDWKTAVGIDTDKQTLRVQSIDYEVSFDRENLNQSMTGLFGQSVDSVNITATVNVLDSDLEHWARASGKWNDYTTGTATNFALTDFQSMNKLCLKIDLFNTKDHLQHSASTLLKQLYFSNGKVTSIGDSRDVPGRGSQTFDIRFTTLIIRGTGIEGRSATTLWGGKDFAFVFMSDDGMSHNVGWAEAATTANSAAKITGAVNSSAQRTTGVLNLTQAEIDALYTAGNDYISHAYDHGTGGMNPANKITGVYGTIYGYIIDSSGLHPTDPNTYFADWAQAEPYYRDNIDRDVLTYQLASGTRIPYIPRANAVGFAYPGNIFLKENMWDLFKLGFYGARCGTSWQWFSGLPDTPINSREAIAMMRIPTAAASTVICGNSTDVLTENQIKTNAASVFADFKSGGDYDGGICVIFTHSFGIDAYHITNYPNGYPLSDGEAISYYEDGIRKTELQWIIEEAINQNAKVMTFSDALTSFRSLSHFLNEPETVYGQDYTNDIIYVAGNGEKYPTGKNYADLAIGDGDFELTYRIEDSANIPAIVAVGGTFSLTRFYTTGVIDFTYGPVPVLQAVSTNNKTDTRTAQIATAYSSTNTLFGVSTANADLGRGKILPKASQRLWQAYTDATIEVVSSYSVADITNGYATYGQTNPALYGLVFAKVRSEPEDRNVSTESDWYKKSLVLYGSGGLLFDTDA